MQQLETPQSALRQERDFEPSTMIAETAAKHQNENQKVPFKES